MTICVWSYCAIPLRIRLLPITWVYVCAHVYVCVCVCVGEKYHQMSKQDPESSVQPVSTDVNNLYRILMDYGSPSSTV